MTTVDGDMVDTDSVLKGDEGDLAGEIVGRAVFQR